MKVRILFGALGAAGAIATVLRAPVEGVTFVVLILAMLAYSEFDSLFFHPKSWLRQIAMSALITGSIVALQQNLNWGWLAFWSTFVLLAVVHVLRASRDGDFNAAIRELGMEVLAYIYIIGIFGFLVPIVKLPDGRGYLLLLFFTVFMGDTAAYFVGMTLGKHSLAEKLSPKKSVEGAVGGLLGAFLGAGAWYYLLSARQDNALLCKVLLFTPLLSVLGQLGDLFESMLKRSQAKKDSGTFLPGHGGILDRLDGLGLAAPVFYFYVRWVLERV